MTSFICSLLFLSFTFFSFRLVDPTALKVRITNHALNTLRDEAQAMFEEQVAGEVFEGFGILNCGFRNVKLTEVSINQAHLQFVENYGFQLVIENLSFKVNYDTTFNLCNVEFSVPTAFVATGVSITMEVGLTRNENGRLAAKSRACKASADQIGFGETHLPRKVEEILRSAVAFMVSKSFCPIFTRLALWWVNRKLNTIPMVVDLYPDSDIKLDYSITRDLQVTTTSLEVAFKGLAYRQPQPPPVVDDGVEPVFTEDAMMAYVGISEFFFNSAARCIYEAGFLKKDFSQINSRVAKAFLRIKQLFTQPWNLLKPLEAEVGLTEAPTITITQGDGFIFNMRVRARVIAPETRTPIVSTVSAVCPGSLMITIAGNRLTLPSKGVNCKIVTSNNLKKVMVEPLKKLLNSKATKYLSDWFGDGVQLPIPAELNFIQGNIRYENGYVVVGGDLRSTPTGRQRLADWARGPGR